MGASTEMNNAISLYFVTLEKQYAAAMAVPEAERPPMAEHAAKRLQDILETRDTSSWRDAYLAEQLLATLLPQPMVEQGIHSYLAKARDLLDQEAVAAYTRDENAATAPEARRALLGDLLSSVQWAYGMRTMRRDCQRRATLTGSVYFLLSVLAFGVVIALSDLTGLTETITDFMLPHALAAGLLGASYSTLTSLKAQPDDMPIERYQTLCSRWYILSRILIGLCAALVLYFLLQAELVTGPLLPDITALVAKAPLLDGRCEALAQAIAASGGGGGGGGALCDALREEVSGWDAERLLWLKNHSLVVVYCFLAGFSEKLVPTLLANVERNMAARSKA